MEKIKKFFKIEGKYKFEWNDLRAFLQIINVALIVFAGFNVGAIFGLCVAGLGLIKDLTSDRHINGIAMHLASILLNVFILFLAQTFGSFYLRRDFRRPDLQTDPSTIISYLYGFVNTFLKKIFSVDFPSPFGLYHIFQVLSSSSNKIFKVFYLTFSRFCAYVLLKF